MSAAYDELLARMREVATLGSVAGLLSWDQETMMPPRGAAWRAEELALLARLAHERATQPRIGDLLAACESDADLLARPDARANLRELRWDHDRATKLPADLVAELTQTASLALAPWKQARERSEFEEFRPWLSRQIELKRRKAACYGTPTGGEPYDALLEDYEPGLRASALEQIFGGLRAELVPLIRAIATALQAPDLGPLTVSVPVDRQRALHARILEQIGFTLDAGRLDTSTHPFSTGLGPGDTRITTRFRDDGLLDSLGSTLHEVGHALYEQGLPKAERMGQPLSEPVSLGIHESQSRLWENQVGRSRAFWSWALPIARSIAGPAFEPLGLDAVYGAVNAVTPNLIRVESDETTYNLHIMLRFDLERALIRGDLAVADLPAAWNERIRADLGLAVPDDRRGCLQDIHWAGGAFGYFPTYTLGNLYAAQFWEAAREAIPALERMIAGGDFAPLLSWLRREIHGHGRLLSADQLCREVTGRALDHGPLMRHLTGKLRAIYRLDPRMTSVVAQRLQVLTAALLFSTGGAAIKACSFSSWQVASFRSGVAALFLIAVLPGGRRFWQPRTLAVGTAYAATMILFVAGNKLTTAANTIFLQSTAPLYLLLLGPWLLHERVRRRDVPFALVLATGLALFFVGAEAPRETAPDPQLGNLVAVASGLCWALTILGLRWLGRDGRGQGRLAEAAVVAGNCIACLVCLPLALPVLAEDPASTLRDWAIVLLLGVVQIGVAYVCLVRGVSGLPALEVSLLLLLEPVANVVWAWLIHAERPGSWSLAGCTLILCATVLRTLSGRS